MISRCPEKESPGEKLGYIRHSAPVRVGRIVDGNNGIVVAT
jgi:hypothetical protein